MGGLQNLTKGLLAKADESIALVAAFELDFLELSGGARNMRTLETPLAVSSTTQNHPLRTVLELLEGI